MKLNNTKINLSKINYIASWDDEGLKKWTFITAKWHIKTIIEQADNNGFTQTEIKNNWGDLITIKLERLDMAGELVYIHFKN